MKKELLTIENLTVFNRNIPVLDSFRLHVYEDEFVLLVGLSGAGKSVLLDVIQGYTPFRKGRIVYGGRAMHPGDRIPINIPVHFIREEHCLVDNLSILENLFVLSNLHRREVIFRKHAHYLQTAELLDAFGLAFLPDQPVEALTKMQKHVIELMKAVVEGKKLIMIDDIMKNYTYIERLGLLKTIAQLRSRGYSILFLSRQTQLVQAYADRMVIMRKGENIRTIFPDAYGDPNIYGYTTGIASSGFSVKPTPKEDRVVMEVSNLSTGGSLAGQSFRLKKNEILGLYDRENLSNFEMVDVILGKVKPVSGRILLNQAVYTANSPKEMVTKGIGIISGNPLKEQLIGSLPVYDNVALNLYKKVSSTNRKMKNYIAGELSKELGIRDEDWSRPACCFSEFVQLKMIYYRWLLFKPKALIAIEPLTKAEATMKNFIIRSLHQFIQMGMPVIIVSSDIKELNEICDRTVDLGSRAAAPKAQEWSGKPGG